MSVVKLLIKIIIIIVLFTVFGLYYYTKKSKDGFQNKNDTDYHYPHFDISANYYELSEIEKAQMNSRDPDSVIIDVGNTFGKEIDRSNIPWDSENRSLKPSQVLWGVISREASASLYHKIFEAEQLAKAKAAEDNKFYFDSALLHYGTSDPGLGEAIKVADFIANFTGPLVVPMIGEKLGGMDPLFEWEVYKVEVPKQGKFATNINDRVMSAATHTKEVTPNMKLKHSRVSDSKNKTPADPKAPKLNSVDTIIVERTRLLRINSSRSLGKLISFYFDALELIPPPAGPILNAIYMVVIMPIVMAIALPLTAPRKGSDAIVEIQTGNVYASLVSMAATALLSAAFPGNVLLTAATMAAALWGALAAFYQQQVAVPAGYKSAMEQMIRQTGHGSGDGKCPNGYVPLDQIWDSTTNMFISFFPILGDLIDLLYPYLCIRKDHNATNDRGNVFSQLVCIRDPYVIPKYMEQSWISSMSLEWPDYNNRLSTGTNIVGGKLRIVPDKTTIMGNDIARGLIIAAGGGVVSSAAIAAAGGAGAFDNILPAIRTQPYWSWSGFTNFNDIKNNPNNYYNLNVNLEGFQRKESYEFIGGHKSNTNTPATNPEFKFFYLDFSDPNILIEMAQFYYNYAFKNAQISDDRTFTVEYIAKINYVTSSSVFTCDAMCEMISVQYDARTGQFIKEVRTYDSDRRFYFRWKPINESGTEGTPGKPVTDIWGNNGNAASSAEWRRLDDAYDEAMYQLNDAIHFPTDPSEDPTGLIGGDVLLTAYELYLEQRKKSDAAADYIVSKNANYRYTIPPEERTDSARAAATALSFAAAEVSAAEAENSAAVTALATARGAAATALTASNQAAEAATAASEAQATAEALAAAIPSAAATANVEEAAAEALAASNAAEAALAASNAAAASRTAAEASRAAAATALTAAQAKQTLLSGIVSEGVSVGKSLNKLKAIYDILLKSIIYTTGQLANDESNTLPAAGPDLITAEENYDNALLQVDPYYLDFKIIKDSARQNYIDLLGRLYTINEDPVIFFKNDLAFRGENGNIANDLQSKMNAVIAAREALWNLHKRDSSTNPGVANIDDLRYKYRTDNAFMADKYYDVTACTHIDGTAPAAVTPDVMSDQSDIRFPCQFNVLPHLKRCENINIRLDKCIDLSNIEQVIQAVQREEPNLRIKTIHSIKARGNNTCQYVWDEYDIAAPATIRQKRVNRVLYQQDLSSCTFCLPEVIPPGGTSKVQMVYVDNSDNKVDDFIAATKKYEEGSTPIETTSIANLTVPATGVNHFFQPLNNYINTNSRLVFKKANYSEPDFPEGGGEATGIINRTGQLYVPRYDVNNQNRKLPDLVRPKKAIRVTYPNSTELSLDPTNFSNFCSDPVNMSNFILRYNRIAANNNEMIVNIQRAFTTGENTCDYEIDVFSRDPIQKNMYDDPIMTGGNTTPLLETSIKQIVKIDENGTKVNVASVTGFSKGMMLKVEYSLRNTIQQYRLRTSLIIGVGELTPNIFNPYEKDLRTRLRTTSVSEYVGDNNTIIGFNLHIYKLTVDSNNAPTNLTFIVTVTLYNSVSKLTTTKVVKFSTTSFTTNSAGNISYTATIDSNLGPTVTYTISSCSLHDDLTAQLTSLGNLTSVNDNTLYKNRDITINTDSLAEYDTVSSRRSISQAIQGLRVVTSVDISNNKHYITYSNDEAKLPLDINYYPVNDVITNGSHSTQPLIKDIPANDNTTIGKFTLKNTVTRKTVSYNMTSSPPLTTEAYQNTPFTYNSINTTGDGLEIKRTTSTLRGTYSNTGYNFAGPAKSNIDSIFGSNTAYFNDKLVTDYTSTMSNILNKTSDFLKPIVQAIKLSNIVNGTNVCAIQPLSNACSTPIYMQRIMDSYNNGNSPIGIYYQERNTMTKIIQASTGDGNICHVIFENKNERFNNITSYDSNNSNNYTVTNTLKFMSFPMSTITTSDCDFIPRKVPLSNVIGASTISIYPAIKASDLTLSYGNNFPPPYIKPLRASICQVGHTDSLFASLRTNYRSMVDIAGHPLSNTQTPSNLVYRIVGYDKIDYLVSVNAGNNLQKVIIRAKFDLAPYPSACSWSYTNGSFKVQLSLSIAIDPTPYKAYPYIEIIDTNSVSLGVTDNISPLFFYPEF